MPLYLYIKKLYNLLVGIFMGYAKSRRAEIKLVIKETERQTHSRGRTIKTVDPLISTTRQLYPYLTERELLEYAQTALRVIIYERSRPTSPQPTQLNQYQ